ncbi:glycosyltransferase [Methylopila henanensis]|uniref:Glycosyltransferase n=1 Tax=Methylopila henanensis TaxID=873516 RepID=A0ABW4KCE5_9HYPH
MNGGPIGYYVHHHGEGHRQRAQAIAAQAPGRFTLIGTGVTGLSGPFEVLELPDDRIDGRFSGEDGAADRPDALHYAPLGHPGVRDRTRIIAAWIAERRPALMVVDVSVEVAMLARLCATPTVYVRLAGARWDPAHLDAFRGAKALLAPFDPRCETDDVPDWVRAKTFYASGLGSFPPAADRTGDVVLVAFGRGGSRTTAQDIDEAARATPDRQWRVIGPIDRPTPASPNLDVAGWVDHAEDEIGAAGVVVGGAGDGTLGAVAAAGRPFVCIPEDRPFAEQRAKAAALDGAGAAVVLSRWPSASAWPRVLKQAEALDRRRIASFHDAHGARTAASLIEGWADR